MGTDPDLHGYPTATLRDLNVQETNWQPAKIAGCDACRGLPGVQFPPSGGSYASTLVHYEGALGGPLPRATTWAADARRTRLMVLFQDPRAVTKFPIADPRRDPANLGDEHRYFLLSPLAWRSVKLDSATRSANPTWPTEDTAHLFLRRYFGVGDGGRGWAYDGFIAYFFWLLQPSAAYVTNVAKCFFGEEKNQPPAVLPKCAEHHLAREVDALRPNLVLSFTAAINSPDGLCTLTGATARADVVLRVIHPGAPMRAQRKGDAFSKRLRENSAVLAGLGYDVDELLAAWDRHRRRALG